ncbi:MAG TPA: hypothetical protein VFQ92_16295 [Blastocatellia bacterium]|nr:hypothetical protein [Blastocatellia bacterium]
MTTKPPEEGELWEWRAFGRVSESLSALVCSHPVRMGLAGQSGEDIYFVSPTSDQNVKLRRWGGEWVLKFKLLLATADNSMELYSETSKMLFFFPVPGAVLYRAAQLLDVSLESGPAEDAELTDQLFIDSLAASHPPAVRVDVAKTRSQYDLDGGWVEIADVTFPSRRVQSLSIHSPDLESVKNLLSVLQPGPELEAMNYVEACRRWA